MALNGGTWRGLHLQVRRSVGRGGLAGVAYEVATKSFPAEFLRSVTIDREPPPERRSRASNQDPVILQRLEIVAPALETSPASGMRAQAVQLAAIASGLSTRTLYRWIKQYESEGVRGLARARPKNAGKRRVQVSRPFDQAWFARGYREDELAGISSDLAKALKGLWASRAEQAGSGEVRRLAEFMLQEICEAKHRPLPRAAFRLSRRGVERFAHYRVVNQHRNDRKAFDDAKPRIRRDWTGLAPMERVVADVKHLDVIVRRADGSSAWPKIIAFMDAGTGRVFVHPILLERGEGVRQEHVIEAFLAMVAVPAWGFPQGLYLDNGSEFSALLKIDSALQLLNEAGARTVIFARPYNASAKPIESLFARLDRYVFSMLPGYAGPNRMAKKTQSVGKPPQPYPGDWEDFCTKVQQLIRAHNHRPVGGQWAGRSPEAWFQEKTASGWRPVTVEAAALDAAFADTDSRRVDRGVLKIGGQRYAHERLAALPSRTVVDLALPWRRGSPPLAKLDGAWVYLAPETAYPARWIEGAGESNRRQRQQKAHVAALSREAPAVDPVATKIRWAQRIEDEPQLSPHIDLDLGAETRDRAAGIRSTRMASPTPSPAELKRTREMALTERLEQAQQRHD